MYIYNIIIYGLVAFFVLPSSSVVTIFFYLATFLMSFIRNAVTRGHTVLLFPQVFRDCRLFSYHKNDNCTVCMDHFLVTTGVTFGDKAHQSNLQHCRSRNCRRFDTYSQKDSYCTSSIESLDSLHATYFLWSIYSMCS